MSSVDRSHYDVIVNIDNYNCHYNRVAAVKYVELLQYYIQCNTASDAMLRGKTSRFK